ncbi:1-phosphofructokinase family hexose kinase [Danxiaibacter flavus]|uniref:1-phosphofructokinase family hexose kinase n=1 Tax=Danxiaibacter flavus TaxID=3049108 RepID=A0ABV3ZAG5_9BACT|nr:1-phosphofructokinase family hexose kinase [Chitinophagaceae bacterium DXS]
MKHSIVTVTFNAAIDKSTTVAGIVPEKKLRCADPLYEAGGGGINVSRAIKKLGGKSAAIYLTGGRSGGLLTEILVDEGVHCIPVETQRETRENFIVFDSTTQLQYRFGMPGTLIEDDEWQECLQMVRTLPDVDYIVASGSLPPGVPVDIFARIASIANNKGARCIVDTSGEALEAVIEEGVFLIKPNLHELAQLVGREELQIEDLKAVSQALVSKGCSEVLVVSMGAAGAMLVTADQMHKISAPPVRRKSTVGAGDSMIGGIVFKLDAGARVLEAVQYGVACGTAATMNAGTALCRLQDVEQLFRQIQTS